MSLIAKWAMKTSRVAHADGRAAGAAVSARRKIVISYPNRRSPARTMPVRYHHSLRKSGCGPSSAGKTNGRGASAREKPVVSGVEVTSGESESRRETERGEEADGDDDGDGDGDGASQARRKAAIRAEMAR